MIKLTDNNKSRTKPSGKQALPSGEQEIETRGETTAVASGLAAATSAPAPSCESGPPQHSVIKLGIDVHLDRYVVVRQIDGGAPQPPQRFSPSQFLAWAKKQTALAKQV